MICYRCDNEAGKEEYCPNCGADLRLFQRAVKMSNVYYNDGLEKARVRNLSGAIVSLQTSLRFYKYNIDARNLLGLIYYEMGEGVEAISEWVISRNYEYSDNRAEYYLNEVQRNKAILSNIRSTVRKYNQALDYCNAGSYDMAFMQLRKVLSLNPKMIKAHQLMALLYMREGKYEQAKNSLRSAGRVDTNNTLTLRYLHEVNVALLAKRGKRKKKDDDLISYQSGNEMIIMPKRFREFSFGASLGYIVLGLAFGIAAAVFLVFPEAKAQSVNEAQQQIVDLNQSLAASNQVSASLQEQIDTLNEELEEALAEPDGAQEQIDSYANLLDAYLAYEEYNESSDKEDALTAGESLVLVTADVLGENAQTLYETISEEVQTAYLAALFQTGEDAYSEGDYETAIASLLIVMDSNMDYEDGTAVYYLAQSYQRSGDEETALTYYQYIVASYPESDYADTAREYVGEEETETESELESEGE